MEVKVEDREMGRDCTVMEKNREEGGEETREWRSRDQKIKRSRDRDRKIERSRSKEWTSSLNCGYSRRAGRGMIGSEWPRRFWRWYP
jgi:hypothetical protein